MPACYKHSAPLEPGGDGNACVLQTFGSAGAGNRLGVIWRFLQTFGSAGAGNGLGGISRFYKHSAPLEPGTGWGESRGSTNSRLRWSREPVGRNLAVLQTFGSAGAVEGVGVIAG